jgi:hypothetical protein
MQHIIAIGSDNQALNGQAHLACQIAGENVAKISRGHGERHGASRGAERQCGIKIVDNLGHDARPVYRVDCHQSAAIRQETLVAETGFYHGLAVVEITLHRQIVDVVALHSGHLPTLYIRHPVVGMQDENIDVLAVFTTLDRG